MVHHWLFFMNRSTLYPFYLAGVTASLILVACRFFGPFRRSLMVPSLPESPYAAKPVVVVVGGDGGDTANRFEHRDKKKDGSGIGNNVLDDVVRMLLPPEQAERYIAQYPGTNFSYYVYLLPKRYNVDDVGQCLQDKFPNSSNCDWGSSVCTEMASHDGGYSTRRFNWNAEFVMTKILSDYQGPLRTNDPTQADLFIVPFPCASYCMCHADTKALCNQVQLASVLGNLPYLNERTLHRHFFFHTIDAVHPYLKANAPLLGSTGAKRCVTLHQCGYLEMPYANTNPQNQPKAIHHTTLEDKVYAMSAFISPKIAGESNDRRAFFEAYEALPNNQTLGGLPTLVNGLKGRHIQGGELHILQAYRDSVFCPTLRGDSPPQKRFFDVLLNGCIPVVLAHDESTDPPFASYFAPGGASTARTYPYAIGSFDGWPQLGINYETIVVEVNGTCGMSCFFPLLEDLLVNRPNEIRAKQQEIARLAPLLTYGMEQSRLQQADATAALLVQARHHANTYYHPNNATKANTINNMAITATATTNTTTTTILNGR